MMIIQNEFELLEFVYLKTDSDHLRRIITQITVCPEKSLLYQLSCGSSVSNHYAEEITRDKVLTGE